MNDLLIVGGMLGAISLYVAGSILEVRHEVRELARKEAERQADRACRRQMLQQIEYGATWAMQRTPSSWVR